jgi:hypothetical protein
VEQGQQIAQNQGQRQERRTRVVVVLQPGVLEDLSDLLDRKSDGSVVDGIDVLVQRIESLYQPHM